MRHLLMLITEKNICSLVLLFLNSVLAEAASSPVVSSGTKICNVTTSKDNEALMCLKGLFEFWIFAET